MKPEFMYVHIACESRGAHSIPPFATARQNKRFRNQPYVLLITIRESKGRSSNTRELEFSPSQGGNNARGLANCQTMIREKREEVSVNCYKNKDCIKCVFTEICFLGLIAMRR